MRWNQIKLITKANRSTHWQFNESIETVLVDRVIKCKDPVTIISRDTAPILCWIALLDCLGDEICPSFPRKLDSVAKTVPRCNLTWHRQSQQGTYTPYKTKPVLKSSHFQSQIWSLATQKTRRRPAEVFCIHSCATSQVSNCNKSLDGETNSVGFSLKWFSG